MKKEEIAKALKKIEIVRDWYDDMTGEECNTSIQKAQDLIEALEEVEQWKKAT